MESRPLVSCIVPVFNGERFLAEALDSALGQPVQALEIIVVDDGSTDSTAEILARYGDRIRSFRQDNAGPAAARNRGIQAARGQYVAFLDADDLWAPEKLERQLAHLAGRPDLDACVTYALNFWSEDLKNEADRLRGHRLAKPLPAFLFTTLLAPRQAFDRVGLLDPQIRFGHSTDWFLRAKAAGLVIEALPEVLYRRRIHGRNRSRVHAAESRDEFLRLVKRKLDMRRGRTPPPGSKDGGGTST